MLPVLESILSEFGSRRESPWNREEGQPLPALAERDAPDRAAVS